MPCSVKCVYMYVCMYVYTRMLTNTSLLVSIKVLLAIQVFRGEAADRPRCSCVLPRIAVLRSASSKGSLGFQGHQFGEPTTLLSTWMGQGQNAPCLVCCAGVPVELSTDKWNTLGRVILPRFL